MPKISKIRIVNLTYNDNRHIYDETFNYFNGANTLMTLANGGGKSVFVQMAMQPVVPNLKLKTRLFSSYFEKSAYPTYIMTEWILDNNNGKLLTGLGVRKVTKTHRNSNETTEELKIITFTHEYKDDNEYDIEHMPVTQVENGQTRMISFDEVERQLSNIEKGNDYKLRLFRHSNPEDKARYASELNSYKINRDEFEGFIVKINEREAGLANYFEKSKTSKTLISNEFLSLIDARLNKEGNIIKNIRELIGNHAQNLVKNEEILRKKELYEHFKIKSQEILIALEQYNEALNSITQIEGQIGNLYVFLKNEYQELQQKETAYLDDLVSIDELLRELAYEKVSNEYHEDEQFLLNLKKELLELETSHFQLGEALNDQEKQQAVLECAKRYKNYLFLDAQIIETEAKLKKEQLESEKIQALIQDIEFSLNQKYATKIAESDTLVKNTQSKVQETKTRMGELADTKKEKETTYIEEDKALIQLDREITKFHAKKETLQKYPEFTLSINPITGEYPADEIDKYQQLLKQKVNHIGETIAKKQSEKETNNVNIQKAQNLVLDQTRDSQKYKSELEHTNNKLKEFNTQREAAVGILKKYEISENDLFDKTKITACLESEVDNYNQLIKQCNSELESLNKDLAMYESGRTLQLPEDLLCFFAANHIHVEFGFEWLKNYNVLLNRKKELVKNNPFIPYSLILTQREFERVRGLNLNVFTSVTLPILERESLEEDLEVISLNQVYSLGKVHFLMSFNQELLDEAHLAMLIETIKEKINDVNGDICTTREATDNVMRDKHFFETFSWTPLQIDQLEVLIKDLANKVIKCNEDIQKWNTQIDDLIKANALLDTNIKHEEGNLLKAQRQTQESNELFLAYEQFLENSRLMTYKVEEQARLKSLIEKIGNKHHQLDKDVQELEFKLTNDEKVLMQLKGKAASYSKATTGNVKYGSIVDLEAELKGLTDKQGIQVQWLTERLKEDNAQQVSLLVEIEKYGIPESEYSKVEFSELEFMKVTSQISNLKKEKDSVNVQKIRKEEKIENKEENLNKKKEDIRKRYDGRDPKDVSLILQFNFDEAEKQLISNKEQTQTQLSQLKKVLEEFNTRIISMDEYKDFGEDLADIEPVIVDNLNIYKHELLQKYKKGQKIESNTKAHVATLYSLAEQEFSTKADVFKQLFENILFDDRKFVYDYGTNAMYRTNLQIDLKLEQYRVDYENIQSMQDNIIEMAYGYVLNVYSELDSFDSNSTIDIDGLRRKMLVIELPDKARLEEMILKQYVKGTISNCVELIKQNKTTEAILNSEINTNNLFDRLVDLNRVEVKILKVEQNKTKLKTWAEANSISGGESFVSIFVVFITLMSYLRGGNALKALKGNDEGKVLIMDNPFGPISSEHLLIPMFSIAKKYNTQLICLTDIDKHTICDRFDVIYGMRIEKEIGREHEYIDVRLEKNEIAQEEKVASSLFKIEKKQLSMF